MSAALRLLAAAAAAVVCGCTAGPERPHVLLVVADTLRADRLGAERGLTPFLDSLASRGVRFAGARAQSSWTQPSIASLFTSRYVTQHGVDGFRSILPQDEQSLAEAFRAAGYQTAGFSANLLLTREAGFAQGFDHWQVLTGDRSRGQQKARGETVNQAGLQWLDAAARDGVRPCFLYLHYMEPHLPYGAPAAVVERVLRQRGRAYGPQEALARARRPERQNPDPALLELLGDLYDAEVASLDASLGELFAELERRGLLRQAVVAITADHGDEFGEHGGAGHGQTLFEELVHVPLLLLAPGLEGGRTVDVPVSHVDLAATLVELAGLPVPASFEGQPLAAGLRAGGAAAPWPAGVLSQLPENPYRPDRGSGHRASLVAGSRKLVLGIDGSRQQYDLARDPGERRPEALPQASRGELDLALERALARAGRDARREAAPEAAAELRARLRALGYLDE